MMPDSNKLRNHRSDKQARAVQVFPNPRGKHKHTPSHWPRELKFITELHYSPSIPYDILCHLRSASVGSSSSVQVQVQVATLTVAPGPAKPSSPTSVVAIRLIESPSHPAHGQMGLFASKKIPPNTHIIEYLGEVHADERPSSDYDLSLYRSGDGLINVGIDASCMGNEARFVNDYRGIKPKPNVIFKESITPQGGQGMAVWSGCQAISKGEELLLSYGKAWWNARN